MTPMSTFSTVIVGIRGILRCGNRNHALSFKKGFRYALPPHGKELLKSYSTVCHPASKDHQRFLRKYVGAKSITSIFLRVNGRLQTSGQEGGYLSRSLSTTRAVLEQAQETHPKRVDEKTENSSLNREVDSNSGKEPEPSERSTETDEYLSTEQWKALKDEWVRKVPPYHSQDQFESRAMTRFCRDVLFQRGRSLMEFVRQEGTPLTYPLMASYLFLCVRKGDHGELFAVRDWFADNHPVLDDGVLNNLIAGFCQTGRWRESLAFLEDMKRVGAPSARTYHSVISAACDHGDYGLVEELLADLFDRGTCPAEQTCLKLLRTFYCETEDREFYDRSSRLVDKLLWYLREKRFYPSVTVGTELKNWFHSKKGESWKATLTRITKSGKCRACGSVLESLDISQEDFLNLQQQITEKVIKGGDIFKKTRPDELEAFMEFVNEGGPYDVIIDGLNVAHIKQNPTPSKVLRQFVVYLAQECGLKCLVLGRQHMRRYSKAWNQHHMDAIRDVADCFFTENVSQDDPFMLYATLHSGPKACYVSRDMLRDHKALLDQPTHLAFVKWQRGHQMFPLGFQRGKAVFKERIAYDTVTQSSNSSWHIPCDDGAPRYSYQVPLDWLCARKVK